MKKFIKALTCLVFALLVCVTLTACKKSPVDYKLGMGVEVSLASSKEAAGQVDATVAAVLLDKDGKIVSCRVDAVQNKATLADGVTKLTLLKTM